MHTWNYDGIYTCILKITTALNEAKNSASTTGQFNFQIARANGNTNEIGLTTGEGMSATDFANKKLGWNDVESCTIKVEYDTNNNIYIPMMSGMTSMQMPSSNINMFMSTLTCSCADGKSQANVSFQSINLGNYGPKCSQAQKK